MNLNDYSHKELLDLACSTTDQKILELLVAFESMFVRRAVARNSNSPSHVIDRLAHDPVQNVSYMAHQHRNCTVIRSFSTELHDCVVCSKDERTMDCSGCNL